MVDKRKRADKGKPQRRRGRKDGDEKEDRSKRSNSAKSKQQPPSTTSNFNNNKDTAPNHHHHHNNNKKDDRQNPNGVAVAANKKPHQSLLIQLTEDAPTWYDFGNNLPGRNSTIHTDPPQQQQQQNQQQHNSSATALKNSAEMVAYYRSWADQIIRTEMELFAKSQGKQSTSSSSSSSDQQWIQNTMKHGTLKDRIAAMSVVVSTNPIHKFHSIDGLLNMAGCSSSGSAPAGQNKPHSADSSSNAHTNSRVAQMAAEALEELFLHTFLPPNRKLISLDQRPLYRYSSLLSTTNTTTTSAANDNDNNENKHDGKQKATKATTTQQTLSPRILLLWRLEELIKDKYHSFLSQYLERTLRREGLDVSRMAALRTAGNLLRRVPEGEVQLLSMLVNKLGDPSKKVAATAAHELRRLIDQHSNMQAVVAREVQQLAHRPHLSARALYNCITFLNQLRLYKEDAEEEEVHQQQQNNIKEAASGKDKSKKPTPSSTKTTATTTIPFNSKTLSASLIKTYFQLFEVAVHRTDGKESGKRGGNKNNSNDSKDSAAMKGRLLSALLTGVNRAHPYLPEKDQEMEEHIDALYRIVHTAPPSACTQALMLLFQLAVGSSSSPSQPKTNNNKKKNKSPEMLSPSKSTDHKKARQDRFYRALYASMSHQQQQQPALLSSGKHLTLYCNLLYKAMKHDTEPTRVVAFAKQLLSATLHSPPPIVAASLFLIHEVAKYQSNHHFQNHHLQDCWEQVVLESRDAKAVWDPTKREPRGALLWKDDETTAVTPKNQQQESATEGGGGGVVVPVDVPTRAPLWELSLTAHHFHPSVAKFTSSMGQISYAGDPLRDFGLAPFLNKFAYRNPKSLERLAQQQKQRESVADRKTATKETFLMATPVNDPSFLRQEQVGEQDEFYHKFFAERARRDKIKGIVRGTADATPDEEEEDEDNALDTAEANDMDQDFETLEEGWVTDEEEEAFVDSLAVSLMEDSMDVPIDLDDEDPDTEDWDDLKADEGDDGAEEEQEGNLPGFASDEEFLDEVEKFEDSDDDDDDNDDENEFVGLEGQDGSSDDSHVDDDDEDLDEDIGKDSEFENEKVVDDGFDSDVSEERPRKKRSFGPTFADASEYEELINKGWEQTKGKQKPTAKPKGKRSKK